MHNSPNNRFARSREILEQVREYEALIDARPGIFFSGAEPIGGHPLFVDKAAGAYLWDVDGNRYCDFHLGFGSVILGHADSRVNRAAAAAALELGANPTLLNRHHAALAQKIVEVVPGIDQVTFMRTGSDAISAAVRLARAITGRSTILNWGMHGWHDWCAIGADGILTQNRDSIVEFQYNDIDNVEALIARHGHDLAAIVMMPYEIEAPANDFLHKVRALAHSHGALFILDEVRSGFRIANGGAQEYFGVDADLVAFSKAIGNGYSISVLAGKYDHMQEILRLGLTVTFYRSPIPMAAAFETINAIVDGQIPARLKNLGSRLMKQLDTAFSRSNVPGTSVGFPATPFVKFDYRQTSLNSRVRRYFSNAMLDRGFIMSHSHHWFLCASMTEMDIDLCADAAAEVIAEIARRY